MFLVAGEVELFRARGQPSGGVRSSISARIPSATDTPSSRATPAPRGLGQRRRLTDTKLRMTATKVRIEHVAPDLEAFTLVKRVRAGDAFESSQLEERAQLQTCSAWTVMQSCVYSLSNHALGRFIRDFPAAALELQAAFVGVFEEQERRARREASMKRLRRLHAEVSVRLAAQGPRGAEDDVEVSSADSLQVPLVPPAPSLLGRLMHTLRARRVDDSLPVERTDSVGVGLDELQAGDSSVPGPRARAVSLPPSTSSPLETQAGSARARAKSDL